MASTMFIVKLVVQILQASPLDYGAYNVLSRERYKLRALFTPSTHLQACASLTLRKTFIRP